MLKQQRVLVLPVIINYGMTVGNFRHATNITDRTNGHFKKGVYKIPGDGEGDKQKM
jgi:hypothetical protein